MGIIDYRGQHDAWIRFVVTIGDLLLCNLVFFLAFRRSSRTSSSARYTTPASRTAE